MTKGGVTEVCEGDGDKGAVSMVEKVELTLDVETGREQIAEVTSFKIERN